MLNPTEYFFNEIRSMTKSKCYKSGASYRELVQTLLKKFKTKSMQGYYTCIAPYIELSLKQQPFKWSMNDNKILISEQLLYLMLWIIFLESYNDFFLKVLYLLSYSCGLSLEVDQK